MRGVLGLNSITVSILFILPIPAAFLGTWYAGSEGKTFYRLTLAGRILLCFRWYYNVVTGLVWIYECLVITDPCWSFFFGAGMLFPLATTTTTGAMEPFPYLAGVPWLAICKM